MGYKLVDVARFIEKNHSRDYSSPKRIVDEIKKAEMTQLYEDAKFANYEFNTFLNHLAETTGLVDFKNKNFLDGTMCHIRSYFWGKLKYVTHMSFAESISVFCEAVEEGSGIRYRVSIDIDEDNASNDEMLRHSDLISMKLDKGLVYLVNNRAAKDLKNFGTDTQKVRKYISDGTYKKAQVSYLIDIDNDTTDEMVVAEIEKAVNMLIKYYNHVIGIK
ncbi:hypothetical protein [Butyrivibrio sp. NC2002]|uniref:hypothetical protein n=1 Tax=Butyrivibrio sp. NC2002 TaxID=1410610 RepID=UPI000566BEE1|nr:hypothetical protein [Butyrivibrio sp. NC2002]